MSRSTRYVTEIILIIALQIIGGLFFLFIGGESLVRGAVALSRKLGMPPFIIGLTVVAYGTSSPELVISLHAAFDGLSDIALGNVVGSNISNVLCVLGITAMIYPMAIDKKLTLFDGCVMLGITLLFYLLCWRGVLDGIAGGILIAALVTYTAVLFYMAKTSKDKTLAEQTEEIEQQTPIKLNIVSALAVCAFGILMLVVGSNILIKGAVACALLFGVSEAVIGLTLIAFGGSVPELVTSIISAFHKHSGIVLGNIIGSNVFNIVGIIGITGSVQAIGVDEKFLRVDLPILLGVTVLLVMSMYLLPKISRLFGGLMVAGYAGYVAIQYM